MTRHATVRMYNVGFGDAFLLTYPTSAGKRRVLIDCGSHMSGAGPHPISKIAKQIVADVTEGGTAKIDVVVATHRHYDHISGFDNAVWADVEVGEVWLPWTEGPSEGARGLRARYQGFADVMSRIQGLDAGVQGLVLNAASNADAMATLCEGFAGGTEAPRRYLPDEKRYPQTFKTPALPGVTVHVLGPSLDEDVIAAERPPSEESYLRPASGPDGRRAQLRSPFSKDWIVRSPFEEPLFPAEKKAIQAFSDLDHESDALALDAAINNTSLVLVFEIGHAVLLFTGDAQWGTWNMALASPEARDLLARTTFLKVGHHGSHNATPVSFVEEVLRKGVPAMISTLEGPGAWRNGIPRKPLLDALTAHEVPYARSDDPAAAPKGFTWSEGELYVDFEVPL